MTKQILKEVDALAQVLQAVQGLEDPQKRWVFASALSNLGLDGASITPLAAANPAGNAGAPALLPAGGTMTAEDFIRSKNPLTGVQRVVCLAFYLNRFRGQTAFNTKELTALNTEAAGIKIGNPAQTVANATKQSQYLAPAGGGKKQITSFGKDVVNALPDQDKVKALDSSRARPKRRAKRKASGK